MNGAKNRDLKQEITIHNVTIAEFGKPDEELEACKTELAEQEARLQAKINERDQKKLILSNQQEAAERKLLQPLQHYRQKRPLQSRIELHSRR